ncbi:exodeoxyribonuclease V subunit alpha [Orbus sturtevantii]|uniref:exodeoxyribonuclease V subunit alpha n=1 Tax=Orbus sturtevantii TaxID=3074109 RepID=UPI00370DB1DC
MVSYIALLDRLKTSGLIVPLDFHLALFFSRRTNLTDPLQQARFAFLVAWLSVEVRAGHVCVNLAEITRINLEYRFGVERVDTLYADLGEPKLDDWLAVCDLVGQDMVSHGEILSPFILNNNLLYFQRMWQHEKHVADYFNHTVCHDKPTDVAARWLQTLFPINHDNNGIDWQKVATASAITQRVAIISGGPGTGKTTTISKILATLVGLHQQQFQSNLRVVAAAPTGKAAARLTESLSAAVATLPIADAIKQAIPTEAVTLHRLLGARLDSNKFAYHQGNQLSVDVLLIDEASMVDLPMMSSVIAALPRQARLILLGDKEQLSSVEAGAVFGDLCQLLEHGYSEQHVEIIKQLTGYQLTAKNDQPSIADSICLLQRSYRFASQSGIGILANLIKLGHSQEAIRLFNDEQYQDIAFYAVNSSEQYQQAIENCVNHYQFYLHSIASNRSDIERILSSFTRFRLLCALREGPFGVRGLNQIIENKLLENGSISLRKHDEWYIGRPVMILKNSFSLGLFNGDIGIALPAADDNNKLKIYFLLPNGDIKGVSPFRLPEYETAYAMTIHKSQGSEFEHVAVILPNEYSPLLTRSLLYTAVTRAKQTIAVYSSKTMLIKTINSKINRQSGLVDLLV